jgi:hypothetical protein
LSIPPIKFGVPLSSASAWPDQVFWTSGFAHSLQFTHTINSVFTVTGAYAANWSDVTALALVAAQESGRADAIEAFWQGLKTEGRTAVPFVVSTSGAQTTVPRPLAIAPSPFL